MDNKIFNLVTKTVSISELGINISPVTYKEAVPTRKLINVLTDFSWKNAGDVDEVPSIRATEYSLAWGQTITNLQKIIEIGKSGLEGKVDPYLPMYTTGQPTATYIFPYLVQSAGVLKSIKNTWSPYTNQLESKGKIDDDSSYLSLAKNLLTGYGYEDVKKYTGTSEQSVTIAFNLYNTTTPENSYRNYRLISLLMYQNLKNRTTFMTFNPPKIYTLECDYKGGIYFPASYVSDISISSLGSTRVLDGFDDGRILLPEAYKVSLTFTCLISDSANILSGSITGSRVNVLSDTSDIVGGITKGFQKAVEFISNTPVAPPGQMAGGADLSGLLNRQPPL